jgi:hypothetical protein
MRQYRVRLEWFSYFNCDGAGLCDIAQFRFRERRQQRYADGHRDLDRHVHADDQSADILQRGIQRDGRYIPGINRCRCESDIHDSVQPNQRWPV